MDKATEQYVRNIETARWRERIARLRAENRVNELERERAALAGQLRLKKIEPDYPIAV